MDLIGSLVGYIKFLDKAVVLPVIPTLCCFIILIAFSADNYTVFQATFKYTATSPHLEACCWSWK